MMKRTIAWLVALWVGLALHTASAQPMDGDCEPESANGVVGSLVNDVNAAATASPTPAPKARDFAEEVMKQVLADKTGKDRWGYTSHTGDGCFARSYATNYDISKGVFGKMPEGVKIKTIYIYWKNMNWWYHTAAVVSGPDGDFVLDGLNGRVLTAKEWEDYWKKGDHFERIELKEGMYMHPGETHDGKPNLERRLDAQRWINDRKKLTTPPRPTYEYEPPPTDTSTTTAGGSR